MAAEVTVHPRKENTTIETQARHTETPAYCKNELINKQNPDGSIRSAIEMNLFRQSRSTEQDRTVAEKLQSR